MYEAEIRLKESSKPIWVPSRPIPYNLQVHMDAEIDKMEKSGIIGECFYSKWNLPVFLVPKKGGKFRFVCDSRMLNTVSEPDPYELPNISHLLDKLSETKYMSTLDLHQSYFQIGLNHNSQPYTAFSYNGKRYQFLRMLQGHKTSSAQFSRLMSRLFSKVPFQNFLHFVDDLLIGADTVAQHIKRLEYILSKLSEAWQILN